MLPRDYIPMETLESMTQFVFVWLFLVLHEDHLGRESFKFKDFISETRLSIHSSADMS